MASLDNAVELFAVEFWKRYPRGRFQIEGEGYEDEDLDLNVYAEGDQLELERHAVKVSHVVQSATGYFILPFIRVETDSSGVHH